MDNPLEVKNITIAGAEDVQWGVKLKDENGTIFNVPKFKKTEDDEPKIKTVAFKTLETLAGYGMGLKKCVKFATVDNSQGGKSRYVRIIEEAQDIPVAQDTPNVPNVSVSPQNPPMPASQPPVAPPVADKMTKADWDKKSFGMCKHAFLIEAFKASFVKDIDSKEIIEQVAEQWATMSMRVLPKVTQQDKENIDNWKNIENKEKTDITMDEQYPTM